LKHWTPKQIRDLRSRHDLTQEELGDLLGDTPGETISRWENGHQRPVHFAMAALSVVETNLERKRARRERRRTA
jgi:DNA-binding transcriptional regulator YiaG